MNDDIPDSDDLSIPSSVDSGEETELRGVVEKLRELQHSE